MTEALGTFTPTSITVVETKISISPLANDCIMVSFSSLEMRPCNKATRADEKRWRIFSKPAVASFKSRASDSSISGKII